eukprot:SAG11_NODE_909_length_6586_cov_11.216433_1_plen_43_part_00
MWDEATAAAEWEREQDEIEAERAAEVRLHMCGTARRRMARIL